MDQKAGPPDKRLQPVGSRRTVQDQVYEQLRDALISGAFLAGESFTIAALSDRFQTSHMPVREALRRLAAENALRISPTGTAYVPAVTRAELDDITQARVIIEGATAGIAARRMGPDDIVALGRIIERHERAAIQGEIADMVDTNRAFHFHIYRAAGSAVLLSQIENLWLRLGPYVRFLSDRMGELLKSEHVGTFAVHHRQMVAALQAGDVGAFRSAMEADVQATCDRLIAYIPDEP